MARWLGFLVLAIALFSVGDARATPIGATAIEASLLAPCCYGGTLDIHDSAIARELRHEIEARVANGESADSIENDFVVRYGPQVRALPNGGALATGFEVCAVLAVVAAIGLAFFVRRLRGKKVPLAAAAPAAAAPRDALDARLDAELADLDA